MATRLVLCTSSVSVILYSDSRTPSFRSIYLAMNHVLTHLLFRAVAHQNILVRPTQFHPGPTDSRAEYDVTRIHND